jgi:cytochrome P450
LLPQASFVDSLAAVNEILVPLPARALILRRPRVVALEAKLDADRRAVRLLQRLRRRYGSGPLRLSMPGRSMVLILSTEGVRQVLEGSPDPFATANREKRSALSHFQPHGVLISQGRARENRRSFNEAVLGARMPVHHLADEFVSKVNDESQSLLEMVVTHRLLTWSDFSAAYWRIVRRVVLGDAARDDHETTNVLSRLRADANWSYLKPRRKGLQQVFEQRVRDYLQRAEKGSLAAVIAAMPITGETQPESQVGHWLFAFDAAAMATYRALALLVAHPAAEALARQEISDRQLIREHELPFLRTSVLEAIRLWPTTPLVLRDTVSETIWNGRVSCGDCSVDPQHVLSP